MRRQILVWGAGASVFLLGSVAKADSLMLADFESGASSLEGTITRDEAVAKGGKASGRVDAKLAGVTQSPWITLKKPLDLRNPVQAVSLWVKSAEAKSITVQVIDATKQTLQVRPKLTPGADWQQVMIKSFESGDGFQAYGGANDKKVHWPISTLNVVVEKNGLEGGNGTVWLDDIRLETEGPIKSGAPAPEEILAGTKQVVVADFEGNDGGFTGPLTVDAAAGRDGKGTAKVAADFSNAAGGAWTTLSKNLEIKNEIKAVGFWVKSREAKQLTVKIVDATGQTLQVRPAVKPDGQWQQVLVTSFEGGLGFQAYGGANDKKAHWPAKSFAIIVEKNGLEGGKGTVWLDDVVAYVNPERLVGKLDLKPNQPGNTFYLSEPVRLPVETQGDKVQWKATDFSGQTIGQGSEAVINQTAVIAPKVERTGYYEVQLTAQKGGETLAEGKTSFVVTTPLDLGKIQDSPFGLMTHFAQNWPIDVIPALAKGGVKNIRDEQYWGHVEKTKGQYAFGDKFQAYMAALKAAHIDPLIVLSFGNRLYDDTPDAPGYGNAPYTDEGRAAYTRYGQEVLRQYGSQIKAVEVWNEYNGTFGKGPVKDDKARYYAEMIKTAYPALKQVRPDINVVGVSAVAVPYPYFEDLFKRGSLKYMDSLSLHPYRTQSLPEGLDRQLLKLQVLVKKYSGGKTVPLWITELGWYLKPPDKRSDIVVTEADQAKYLVRANALTLSAGVEKFYWYHAHDDASFPTSGVLRGTDDPTGRYAPKPAFAAFAAMQRELLNAKFEAREPTVDEDTYSIRFATPGGTKRVLWSLQPRTLTLKTPGSLTVTDLMGNAFKLQPTGGEVKLALTDVPVYVTGPITALPPLEAAPGKLIAASEEDFSEQQGGEGWSYGYYVSPTLNGPYDAAQWKPFPRYNTTIWGYEWTGDQKYLLLSPTSGHPGFDGKNYYWAVRRYNVKTTGNLRLRGTISRPDVGDGTTARIFVDGKEVWTQKVAGGSPSSVKYDLTVPVKAGSLLDFAIDPNANTEYDATFFPVSIFQLP